MEVRQEKRPLISAEEQERRRTHVEEVEASEALEGYAPLGPKDGLAYELREAWVRGEITTEEWGERLRAHLI